MQICKKHTKIYNTNIDLDNDNVFTKFGLIKSFSSQDIEQKHILTSIKGRNSVANMRKTMIYNTNVDLVNDVYTKFGLNRSIRFQDIEQKLNSNVNQGPQLCCKLAEIRTHPSFHACPRYLQE